MQYSELRQFLKESNAEGLSPIEKDVFQYYHSRTQNDEGVWFCPDSEVAEEIFRSRNGVCSARKSLIERGWITENGQFNICVVRKFSVRNQTIESEIRLKPTKPSPKSDSPVRNQTENASFESEIRLNESEIRLTYKEEEKEDKQEKRKEEEKRRRDVAVQIFDYWVSVCLKDSGKAVFNSKRKLAVEARLKEGYLPDDIKAAINGCNITPHNNGQNSTGEIFKDLELICRNGSNVERFRQNWQDREHLEAKRKIQETKNGSIQKYSNDTHQRESDAKKRIEFSSVADEILRREGIIPADSP